MGGKLQNLVEIPHDMSMKNEDELSISEIATTNTMCVRAWHEESNPGCDGDK